MLSSQSQTLDMEVHSTMTFFLVIVIISGFNHISDKLLSPLVKFSSSLCGGLEQLTATPVEW